MKTPISLLLLLLAFVPWTFAQESALLSAIEALPSCALQCLTTALATSPCEATNQTCICLDDTLQSNVTECVIQSCTVKQGLVTKNITMSLCGAPVRDRRTQFKVLNITLGVISIALVTLRIVYKLVITMSEIGWDDMCIVTTLVVGIPSTILTDRGTIPSGLGKDIWTLSFSQVTNFIQFFYVMEILYFTQVALLKLVYLFFYLRIFPGKPVQLALKATIVFNILWGAIFTITAIFQCKPISYYWNSWDGEHTGKCININALGWTNAAMSIALDIWMIAIPLSQLVHLKLAWRKKVGVAMMFCVGTFVTVVSILRLQSLVHFAKSQNPTWDQWEVSLWSTIEINVGLICACMPAIRVVLVRFFPKVFGTTIATSNQYYQKYGSNSKAMGHGAGASSAGVSNHSRGGNGVITFTKTFEVQHGDRRKDIDEVGLVELDDFSAKGKSRRNSSELSL